MKLFASDYDGTLFKDRIIREDDLHSIRKFREQGHKFGLVSGRSIDSLKTEIEKHDIPVDFIVGINGGAVETGEGEQLFIRMMETDIAHELIEAVENFGVKFYGANDGYRLSRVYCSDDVDDCFKPNINLVPMDIMLDEGVSAMYVWVGDEDRAQTLANMITEQYGDRGIIAYPNVHSVDIGIKGISKSTGLEMIIDHYNVDDTVYTIGDSFNDVPMIKDFHGFVMENGVDEVKAYGKAVHETVGYALNAVLKDIQ
ncbi:HAD hydrolase family protein [Erysipelothrix inopinata]|uniref:HAD hydrolase family protein n=1 Tax=Erysipelothrix inopinata TaxID=225084 RepID=A0A7G9S1H6_9FIRM|nr:HAD family hydrolase [Erysipelothrix inopinata]QNN61701.1 HAD hydrolase family protein [Erysipelothrix inopinata]